MTSKQNRFQRHFFKPSKSYFNIRKNKLVLHNFFSTYSFLASHISFGNQVEGIHSLWSKMNSTFKNMKKAASVNAFNPAGWVLSSSGAERRCSLCFKGKPAHMSTAPLQRQSSQTISQCFLFFAITLSWSEVSPSGYFKVPWDTFDIELQMWAIHLCFQHSIHYRRCICCRGFITRKLHHPSFILPGFVKLKKRSYLHSAYNKKVNEMVSPADVPISLIATTKPIERALWESMCSDQFVLW